MRSQPPMAAFAAGPQCDFRPGLAKSNSSRIGNRSPLAICSSASKDGALMPRPIRLRKATLILTSSANCSWVSLRSCRIAFSPIVLRRGHLGDLRVAS